MILTCPQCDTRYQADEAKFPPAGRNVRCAKCGNVWHQAPSLAEPEPEIAVMVPDEVVPDAPQSRSPDTFRARNAPPTPAATQARAAWLAKAALALGWLGLVAIVLLIGFSAVRYRQDIAVLWPQSSSVYSALGMPARTLDFRDVHLRRQTEDGQDVLTVTGTIFNYATRELSVPQTIRVTLSDEKNHEVYRWNFAPNATTLKPGQASKFVTRLSNPPLAAKKFSVSFVKDGT